MYGERDCRNLANLHPPRDVYENDLQNAIRALLTRYEEAETRIKELEDENENLRRVPLRRAISAMGL